MVANVCILCFAVFRLKFDGPLSKATAKMPCPSNSDILFHDGETTNINTLLKGVTTLCVREYSARMSTSLRALQGLHTLSRPARRFCTQQQVSGRRFSGM